MFKAKIRADEVRLTQTEIKAPANGAIGASGTIGAVVQPGQELFRLILDERLEWRADVPAAELARPQTRHGGDRLHGKRRQVAGTIRMIAPTVDAQTRNGLVHVDPPTQDAKAGMFARGEIALGKSGADAAAVVGTDARRLPLRLPPGRRQQGRRPDDRLPLGRPHRNVSGVDATQKIVPTASASWSMAIPCASWPAEIIEERETANAPWMKGGMFPSLGRSRSK